MFRAIDDGRRRGRGDRREPQDCWCSRWPNCPSWGAGRGCSCSAIATAGWPTRWRSALSEGLSWSMGGESGRTRTETDLGAVAGRARRSGADAAARFPEVSNRFNCNRCQVNQTARNRELTAFPRIAAAMQAAANRLSAPKRVRTRTRPRSIAALATNDDTALLDALPIAAAIVGLTSRGILKLIDRNRRFDEVIALTGDAAMMSGDFRDCTHLQIAQLMMAFLADFGGAERTRFLRRRGGRRASFPDQARAAAARRGKGQSALPASAWSTARSRSRPSARCAPKCCATA